MGKDLLSRYDEIRHPETGLAGYQFNHRHPCRVRASFKPPFDTREDLNEATVVTNGVIRVRYGRAAVTWLNIAEVLGDKEDQPFRDVVVADLEALTEHCFNTDAHCFYQLLMTVPGRSRKTPMKGLDIVPLPS